jgi:hypothetical protein
MQKKSNRSIYFIINDRFFEYYIRKKCFENIIREIIDELIRAIIHFIYTSKYLTLCVKIENYFNIHQLYGLIAQVLKCMSFIKKNFSHIIEFFLIEIYFDLT